MSGPNAVLWDFWIVSFNYDNENNSLYISVLSNLKLSFCFSFLSLYLRNSMLEFVEEEFAEKVSASVLAISFI